MMKIVSFVLLTIFTAPVLPLNYFDSLPDKMDIVIRHDKNDEEYIELGKEFPAVCKVSKRAGDGTLISPEWILTAAHVAQGMFQRTGTAFKIYFGHQKEGYEVERIFIHPDFALSQGADIALIQLKKKVEGIKPISLYTRKDEAGKEIIIVGHGDFKTGEGGEWKVDGLKRAATNIIDEATQNRIVFDFDKPSAGTELEGTAGRGDSGGPAILFEDNQPFVAGISSAGLPGENGPGTYGAIEHYTRVSAYVDWINETIKNPVDIKALSEDNTVNKNRRSMGRPGGGPVPGLGLILMEENGKIRIGGKADPMVPEAFRQVMFRPPSFLVSFNEKPYDNLEDFKKDFADIKSGEDFTIQFNIQGKLKSFTGKKM